MNYYRMNEYEVELLGRILEKVPVPTDYKIHGEFIPVESLWSIIEDLYGEVEHLQEELEDLKQDMHDNYKPISMQEQIGYDVRSW